MSVTGWCAAAPGSMFEANKFPEEDRAKVHALMEQLGRAKTKKFILISSIAVLEDFGFGLDESTTNYQEQVTYGRHRRELEKFCEETFEDLLIVRLPALFGPGLKKNFIFDLLNSAPSMLPEVRFIELCKLLPERFTALASELYRNDPNVQMMRLDRQALAKLTSDQSSIRRSATLAFRLSTFIILKRLTNTMTYLYLA